MPGSNRRDRAPLRLAEVGVPAHVSRDRGVPETGVVAAPTRQPLGRSSNPERASRASPSSARNWPGANGAVTVETAPAGPALVVASPRLTRLRGDAGAADAVDVGLQRHASTA